MERMSSPGWDGKSMLKAWLSHTNKILGFFCLFWGEFFVLSECSSLTWQMPFNQALTKPLVLMHVQ